MLNMRNNKTRKIVSAVIVIVICLAMILPMALSYLR